MSEYIRKKYEYFTCPWCGKKIKYTGVHKSSEGWCVEYPKCDCTPDLDYGGFCIELTFDPRILDITEVMQDA